MVIVVFDEYVSTSHCVIGSGTPRKPSQLIFNESIKIKKIRLITDYEINLFLLRTCYDRESIPFLSVLLTSMNKVISTCIETNTIIGCDIKSMKMFECSWSDIKSVLQCILIAVDSTLNGW